MNILVTGAKGFVGKNLITSLKNIRDGKDKIHKIPGGANAAEINIYEYDIESTQYELDNYCCNADFVFNLAGVNRPLDQSDFMTGNYRFASQLLASLKMHHNLCPVMLSSSIQATLQGRFENSEYGKSKKAGEQLFKDYAETTGAKVLVYRFPNIFGKWCRPNYNSAIATFCYNIANDIPININGGNTELELLYIDDLVEEMIEALNGREHKNKEGYCYVPLTFNKTLGQITDLLEEFKLSRELKTIPNMADEFTYRLYSTYVSYLPTEGFAYPLFMNVDNRGSFTEILRTVNAGQFSVNILKPGVVRGNHWHHSKVEKFIVVSGEGLIQFRQINHDLNGQPYPVIEYHVSGKKITVIDIPPGYTHNIINKGESDLVTLMWSNECFNPERPDTYFLSVK